jgi:hypothetical protein
MYEMREEASFRRKERGKGSLWGSYGGRVREVSSRVREFGEIIIHAEIMRILTVDDMAQYYWIILSLSE